MRTTIGLVLLGLWGCSSAMPQSPSRAATSRAAAESARASSAAPGAPGAVGTWTSGAKEGVGTAVSTSSRVWFTLQGGILTEVYYPKLDVANVRTLELAVSDGHRVWLESIDLVRSVDVVDPEALLFRQTSRHPGGLFSLRKTYVTDPARDTLLIDVVLEARDPGYRLYVLYDPSLRNTCASDTAFRDGAALLAEDGEVATALVASPPLVSTSSGFVGTSDGKTDLLRHRRLTWSYDRAERGNVLQTAELPHAPRVTLALGFGPHARSALIAARASLERGFSQAQSAYVAEWHAYLRGLRMPREERYRRPYQLAAMVLKAHEDKTARGAMIASMSIPWGEESPSDKANIGGYHLVWARDLYQVATAFLAMGDRPSAERALDFLFRVQQRPDGSFPQNSWLDGKPFWSSLQLDETALPLVLAWQLGRRDHDTWARHVRPAADFIVARGPASPQERWEEESGYSPSTIAAEIAGLVCAAELAEANADGERAARYRRTADTWAASLEKWLVTKTGSLARGGYYLRVNDNTDPDDGRRVELKNRAGEFDEREVVDAGFLELVRLGIRPANDPVIRRSLAVVDAVLRVETPRGPSFYRYNHDGYGEKPDGSGYTGAGIGRLWTLLTGERGEYEVARGGDARLYLDALVSFANAGGMLPEQVWDRLEPSPRGHRFGAGTGSATPLAWSMAQLIRLVLSVEEKRIVEQPSVVAERYLRALRPR